VTTQTVPLITLNNGLGLPALGLGVFQSPPEETIGAVEAAIASGYRLIDTAAAYGNEHEVGDGIRRSGIDRNDIFVTTKLWISDYGHEQALVGFNGCLRRLGFDYIDLFLLHHPVPSAVRWRRLAEREATVAKFHREDTPLSAVRVGVPPVHAACMSSFALHSMR
jgi:diketogulonate reductase-like aldo/keto reductase